MDNQELQRRILALENQMKSLYSSDSIPRDFETAMRERLGNSASIAIGGIYVTTDSQDPSITLGYGTWEAFGAGKTLVGVDTSDTDFDTVEETGGEKEHTLSESEMPAHDHDLQRGASSGGIANLLTTTNYNFTGSYITTETTGGGNAHNNLQPYITVYFWKRLA